MEDAVEEALFGSSEEEEASPANGNNGDDVSVRILGKIESAARELPEGATGVRGIRSTQLLELVREAVEPERLRQERAAELESEVARLTEEARRLREENARLEHEKREVREAQDETRRYELPRLAALVETEKLRADELEEEVLSLRGRVESLQAELHHSEEARAEGERESEALRGELERSAQAEEEERSHAEELLLALDQRIHAIEEGREASGSSERPPDDEETLRLVLEHYARAEERAARIASLEDAVHRLGAGGAPDEAVAEGRQALSEAREAERSSSRYLLDLIKDRLDRPGGKDPRLDELVKTLQAAQDLLQEEVKRRTVLERTVRSLEVRLGALERSRLSRPAPGDDAWSAEGGAAPTELARVVEGLLAREGATQEQVQRLSQATRAALERMAEILDQALSAGSLVRDRLDEGELEELLESAHAQDPRTVDSAAYLADDAGAAPAGGRRDLRRPPAAEELGDARRTADEVVGPREAEDAPPAADAEDVREDGARRGLDGLPADLYRDLLEEAPDDDDDDWLADLSAEEVDRWAGHGAGEEDEGAPLDAADAPGPSETGSDDTFAGDPRTGASALGDWADDTQAVAGFLGGTTADEAASGEQGDDDPRSTRRELAAAREQLTELERRLQEQLDRVEQLERERGD